MKTKLLFLCFLTFQIGSAQNITFLDPVLKNFLINAKVNFSAIPNNPIVYPPIDANNDGEISQSEALNVIALDFYYSNITNLSGLEYFTNIKLIRTNYANFPVFDQPTLVNLEELSLLNSVGTGVLTSVTVANNTNLTKLQLSSDLITTLDFSNNINLKELDVYCPSLVSVNFSNLTNLKKLSYLGKLPTIDISDSTNLLTLTCPGSQPNISYPDANLLTTLDLSAQTKLVSLELAGNNLTSLDLSNCPNLEFVSISNNKISNLNIDGVRYVKYFFCEGNLLTSLNLNALFNLHNLSCKNNQLVSLSTKNDIIEEYIDFSGNPDLSAICCDANEVVYMQNQSLLNNNDSTVVNSDCGNGTGTGKVSMYPNPVSDTLHLEAKEPISKIEIYALNGLMVMSDESKNDTVAMNNLRSGMYFIKVYSGETVDYMKFIKN